MSKDKDPVCVYYRLTFNHAGLNKKYDCHFFDRTSYPEARKDMEESDILIEQILNDLDLDWRHCFAAPDYPISKFFRSFESFSKLQILLTEKLKNFPSLKLEGFSEVEFFWKNDIKNLPYWKYQSDQEAKKWIY